MPTETKNLKNMQNIQQTKSKYRSAKKDASKSTISSSITAVSHDVTVNRINLISRSRVNTSSSSRLLTPVDAEKRLSGLYGSTENSSLRKRRKPTRHLTLKAAPRVPTAPKDPVTIKKNWLITQTKLHIKALDLPLIAITGILCLIGIFSIFSATHSFETSRFLLIQIFATLMGFGVMTVLSLMDYRQFISKYRFIIFLNAAILIFTFLFGQSVTESSNANWIDLGIIKIQPSEFAKLLFIYSFAVHLSHVRDRLNKISTVLTLFVHAGLIFSLVLLQKDLGSFTIFVFIFIAMCFAAGLSFWYYIAGAFAVVCVSPFIWSRLSAYQKDRIMLCFDSSIDPTGVGIRYQQMRSQTAIGNGGITGTGYLEGTVTHAVNGHLPAKHTDMIFSTICEEWGLVGAFIVLLITAVLIIRIIKISLQSDNLTGKYICTGVASMLMIQVIENVGMCLGIMPVIGITFPFLSYGGSSVLSSFIAIGFVLSVCTHEEKTFFG